VGADFQPGPGRGRAGPGGGGGSARSGRSGRPAGRAGGTVGAGAARTGGCSGAGGRAAAEGRPTQPEDGREDWTSGVGRINSPPRGTGQGDCPRQPRCAASLAQLVEQLTLNQRVEGSSPSGGTWLLAAPSLGAAVVFGDGATGPRGGFGCHFISGSKVWGFRGQVVAHSSRFGGSGCCFRELSLPIAPCFFRSQTLPLRLTSAPGPHPPPAHPPSPTPPPAGLHHRQHHRHSTPLLGGLAHS
jgi:hypothetical protein